MRSTGGCGLRTYDAHRCGRSTRRRACASSGESQRSNAGAMASPTAIEHAVAGIEREVAEHRFGLVGQDELQRVVPDAASRAPRTTTATTRRRGSARRRAGLRRRGGDALELGGDRGATGSRACRRSSGRAWPASSRPRGRRRRGWSWPARTGRCRRGRRRGMRTSLSWFALSSRRAGDETVRVIT